MITVEVEGITVEGFRTPPKQISIRVFYALYTRANGILYFDRFQDRWSRVSESAVHSNSIIIPVDPITALLKELATPEEIGLGGVETLVALLKPQ